MNTESEEVKDRRIKDYADKGVSQEDRFKDLVARFEPEAVGCSIDKPLIPPPVRDPFFENAEKLPPRRELEVQLEKWKRRALAFQDGYKEKSFEVTMQEIQIMDLRAHGVDKVTARQNASLKTKLLAACIERNELRELASFLITNAEMIPDPRREGATDCYAVTLDDLEALRNVLDGPQDRGSADE